MSPVDAQVLAIEARRRAMLIVLRANREWSLEQVLSLGEPHHELVGSLTMRELCGYDPQRADRHLHLRASRYARGALAHGEQFDVLVLEVLQEAGDFVRTGYLRARLGGGPRWKVKGSLERLCAQQLVVRVGVTSDTFYCLSSLVEDGDGE